MCGLPRVSKEPCGGCICGIHLWSAQDGARREPSCLSGDFHLLNDRGCDRRPAIRILRDGRHSFEQRAAVIVAEDDVDHVHLRRPQTALQPATACVVRDANRDTGHSSSCPELESWTTHRC